MVTCACVYMCVRICVHVCVLTYGCIFTCVRISVHRCVSFEPTFPFHTAFFFGTLAPHSQPQPHTYIHTYTHTHTLTTTPTHIRSYLHPHTYTHNHTHTPHTFIPTPTQRPSRPQHKKILHLLRSTLNTHKPPPRLGGVKEVGGEGHFQGR